MKKIPEKKLNIQSFSELEKFSKKNEEKQRFDQE